MTGKNLRAAVLGKRVARVWGKLPFVSSKLYFTGGSAASHAIYECQELIILVYC
jgi:hypothetical protein